MNDMSEKKLRSILAILGVAMLLTTAVSSVISYMERQDSKTPVASERTEQTEAKTETEATQDTEAQSQTETISTQAERSTPAGGYFATDEEIMSIDVEAIRNGPSSPPRFDSNDVYFERNNSQGMSGQYGFATFPDEYKVEVLQKNPTRFSLSDSERGTVISYIYITNADLGICEKTILDMNEDAYVLELGENIALVREPGLAASDQLLLFNGVNSTIVCQISTLIENCKINEIDLIELYLKEIRFQ